MEYKIHPVCELFPPMTPAEFADLKADIQAHGQIEPITVFKGHILDGKNRYRVCQELGLEPIVEEWVREGSMVAWAASKNMQRRSLTVGQRALIGDALVPMFEREAKAKQAAQGPRGQEGGRGNKPLASRDAKGLPVPKSPKSAALAAASVGVSEKTIERVHRVAKAAPQKLPKIRSGEITAKEAEREVKEEKAASSVKDGEGRPVDERLAPIFLDKSLDELMRAIRAAMTKYDELRKEPIGRFLSEGAYSHLDAARNEVRASRPYAPCPGCREGCKACKDSGWVPKWVWQGFPEEARR